MSRDANLAIKKSDMILAQFDRTTPEQYSDFSKVVSDHLGVCRELCSHFSTFPCEITDPLIARLEDCMLNLDSVQVRHISCNSSKSVHFGQSVVMSSSEPAAQQHTNTSDSMAASDDSDTGSAGGAPLGLSVPGPHESTRLSHGPGGGNSKSQSRQSHPYIPQPLTEDLSIVSVYNNRNQTINQIGHDSDGVSHSESSNYQHSERFKFNKSPLPSFSGVRKRYPDFRSVWRSFAEKEFRNDHERAWSLKQCLSGEALECVDAISISQPRAYHRIWQRLDAKYLDVSLNIQSIYDDLRKLTSVKEDDLTGLVQFVNQVELCYSRLGDVGQLNYITMPQIDDLNDLLPPIFRWEWMEKHRQASTEDQLYPFPAFMSFLERKRDVAMRFDERTDQSKPTTATGAKSRKVNSHAGNASAESVNKSVTCCIHPEAKHSLIDCKRFPSLSIDEKYEALKEYHFCYRCLSKHPRNKCKARRCEFCKKDNHHKLLCRQKQSDSDPKSTNPSGNVTSKSVNQINSAGGNSKTHSAQACTDESVVAFSNHAHTGASLLPIQDVSVYHSQLVFTVFHDGGSNVSFITHKAAELCKAKRVCVAKVDLTVTGNVESKHDTFLYRVFLQSGSGTSVTIYAYGLPEITGSAGKLDKGVISQLFPDVDFNLVRRGMCVDILLGSDYCGLHPRKELAQAGENLFLLEGPLGLCLQGAHPRLRSGSKILTQMACAVITHSSVSDVLTSAPTEFIAPTSHLSRAVDSRICTFIEGETLGTEIAIKCGNCRCGKCPVPGHTYSFSEEQELHMIRANLKFDDANHHWTTSYPWIKDPQFLPNNYRSALATLQSTERKLKQDPKWADIYTEQIYDMVERKVARKLDSTEIEKWDGPFFYISHLAVLNPKSTSTPVRIVFNSSQLFQGVSLNGCLAKGPDAYINNILGVILRWREQQVALVGDIRKMYNSIHIEMLEQHCHRFLWRDLEAREPDVYSITRVNMGDRPAAAISAEAIYMTADMNATRYPEVARLLKLSTYVDDIVYSVPNMTKALELTRSTTDVLSSAGFTIKHWLFSKEGEPRKNLEDPPSSSNPTYRTQVLGVHWEPVSDMIVTEVKLNFSPKKKGVYTGPDLTSDQIPTAIPDILTRRIVLEQTMKTYDPLGIYCAFTLTAKTLLRETWSLELGWDDALPQKLRTQWMTYFSDLFTIAQWKYDRSLTPSNSVGSPTLIVLSDASDVAYGFVSYIRWKLDDGTYWCRFIMAKCRIAPLRKLSTPQMELNGAVLSKRGRKVIETETRFNFERVYQLVDSETVLCSINKKSTRFKLFEGVRIAEIQSATDGNMEDWYWVSGTSNTADWLTRGKRPNELGPDSDWWRGPAFLYQPESEWAVKDHVQCVSATCSSTHLEISEETTELHQPLLQYKNFSSAKRLIWTLARIINMFERKSTDSDPSPPSFRHGQTAAITPACLKSAHSKIIKDIQSSLESELIRKKGKFSKLTPLKGTDGIWYVGKRLARYNPMTTSPENLQILLPNDHYCTELLLRQAHIDSGHRGRDGTLARFRQSYWITQGAKVARRIVNDCQLCRLRNATLLTQEMGILPTERLQPQPPFNSVMIDLFGTYLDRGEVQKRISGKVYGVIFMDLFSRAVHLEAAFGYDTQSFLQALQRFTNIRGWPSKIFSDPGSQLIGAERELTAAWSAVDREAIYKTCSDQGTEWKFSPADSPWRQGSVEALVKAAKKAIKMSIHDQRLSPSEFMTLCTEISKILNERPLGTLPSKDSNINILTPNCQLIGRPFCRNPGNWQDSNLKTRLKLIDSIADEFWDKWTELYAPSLIPQGKWKTRAKNLRPGDVVAVADSNALRGKYYIAQVHEVFPSRDGVVRKVSVRYKNFKVGERVCEYTGSKDVIVFRSVQKLALLVPANDMCSSED